MADTLYDRIVVTRVPHQCFGCLRSFPRHSKMRRQTHNGDGIVTVYICETCDTLIDKFHERYFDDCQLMYPHGCTNEDRCEMKCETVEQLLELLTKN